MDAQRFHRLIRSLLTPSSRRLALIGLTGTLLPLGPLLPSDSITAKKRKKRRKRKNKKKQCQPACSGAKVCKGGNCVCPSGTDECDGECRNTCTGTANVRNPLTCECCKPPLTNSATGQGCCSGQWNPFPGVGMCLGFGAGHECDFDAQCGSGNCNGFCGT